ncbi:DUF1810 domain-containing protein [Dongia sp.]|uniref:DUF1810 domain-containing protein n=1 Tax=Dongia sp. TaxID=1977262 RepID=UPI0035B0C06B
MEDTYHLQRFVEAQDAVYPAVLDELRAGRKASHWMWFIFPQMAGLGRSDTARFFAIGSRAEAAAYLSHPLLGQRLLKCTLIVNALAGHDAHAVFGSPDDLKFRSSMTLFAAVAPAGSPFAAALDKYFGGAPDPATLALL